MADATVNVAKNIRQFDVYVTRPAKHVVFPSNKGKNVLSVVEKHLEAAYPYQMTCLLYENIEERHLQQII